ncbi:MAG: M15 family peptidase, partial [Gammaproteobacteria bacterium]|nr:M15 family peptidase [Gammaproteobacteria bacterium]
MTYQFSARSYRNLHGVRPELVAVATLALARSEID